MTAMPRQAVPRPRARPAAPPTDAVAGGTSGGGFQALATVLGGLPADLRASLFVVQHIHATFAPMLARRLGLLSRSISG
jgi:two-component system chemotaxis response regulator CheB